MVSYLSIDVDEITIDRTLAARLPRGLAAYYLAAPLGVEDGCIGVAMAHPENETALAVLHALLGAPIVPVRAPAATIRRALAQGGEPVPAEAGVLLWSAEPALGALLGDTAEHLAQSHGTTVTALAGPAISMAAALDVARTGGYSLTVLATGETDAPALLYPQVYSPILLLRRPVAEWRRILVVLRGFTADCHALEWLAPLLQQTAAAVTLLPLPYASAAAGQPLLSLNALEKGHLQDCLRHPALADIPVFIRYRQGPAAHQVIAEARQGSYDLVALAAEGYGAFVGPILAALEQAGAGRQSFLILKPPAAVELAATDPPI